MLTTKAADGTPITVVARTEHVLPSGQKVVRSGRHCEEHLVKRQVLRTVLPTGEPLGCCGKLQPGAQTHKIFPKVELSGKNDRGENQHTSTKKWEGKKCHAHFIRFVKRNVRRVVTHFVTHFVTHLVTLSLF